LKITNLLKVLTHLLESSSEGCALPLPLEDTGLVINGLTTEARDGRISVAGWSVAGGLVVVVVVEGEIGLFPYNSFFACSIF